MVVKVQISQRDTTATVSILVNVIVIVLSSNLLSLASLTNIKPSTALTNSVKCDTVGALPGGVNGEVMKDVLVEVLGKFT